MIVVVLVVCDLRGWNDAVDRKLVEVAREQGFDLPQWTSITADDESVSRMTRDIETGLESTAEECSWL